MMKIRIIKILCVLILGSFVMGLGLEIRPFASESMVIEEKDYELSCNDIAADINEFKSWTYSEIIEHAGCVLTANDEILSNNNLYVKGKLDDIVQSGTYELIIGISDDVYAEVSLMLSGTYEPKDTVEPVKTSGAIEVESRPDTNIDKENLYLNGKLYAIDKVEQHDFWGKVIHFSSENRQYIGLWDWGVYFKATPNYIFLIITLLSMAAVIGYIYCQGNDQREYWGYRGERK